MFPLILLALHAEMMVMDGVAAVVGSVPIMHGDVVGLLLESGLEPASARGLFHGDPVYDAALDELVDEKLLVEAARRRGLYPSSAEVNQRIDAFLQERRAEFPSETAFQQALTASGLTLVTYREMLASTIGDRVAAENYARTISGSSGLLAPADPAAFITDNTDGFRTVLGLANLEWIYLPVLPGNTSEAEALLVQVRNRVETGESRFDVMAMEYSQDGSARLGGDLDWFGPGDMTPAFEARVRDLEPGEMAGPFVTPFGVHLVMLTERDGDRVRASHILRLVPIEPQDTQRVYDQALAIVNAVNAGEMGFEEAAMLYSLDPETRFQGGTLGTVFLAGWDASLSGLVSGLTPGEMSEPVTIEGGSAMALFRLMDDQTPDLSRYSQEDLDSAVASYLWQREFDQAIDSLRAAIPVFYPGLE